jgi:hypothetical protein
MDCACGHSQARVPETRDDGFEAARLTREREPRLEVVERANEKWMSVLRCRECGRYWAEDSISSGQMDLFFFYPIETAAPHAWLAAAEPRF